MHKMTVLLVVGLALAGCADSDPTDGPKATLPVTTVGPSTDSASRTTEPATTEPATSEPATSEPATTEPSTTTPAPQGAAGSKANPLAINEGARIGDWDVTVSQIIRDATAEIQGANQFNDPPEKGVFMKVAMAATYRGETEGQPHLSLAAVLSGSDAVQYKDSDCDASFGDGDYPTLEPGGTTIVAVCIDAPAAAIEGGTLFVEDRLDFGDGARSYWSIP